MVLYLLAALSSLLYALSFPPWNLWWVSFSVLIPLLIAVSKSPGFKTDLKLAFVFNFGIGLCGFSWVAYASSTYGELPLVAGILLWLLFCCAGQLHWVLYFAVRHWITRNHPKRLLVWTLTSGFVYAGIESIYPKLFQDFFGHCWINQPYLRQMAALGTPLTISAYLVFFGESLTGALLTRSKKLIVLLAWALLLLGAGTLYGKQIYEKFSALEQAPDTPHFKVALIQANIGDVMKMAAERGIRNSALYLIDKYVSLSQQAQTEYAPDIIVWPETAYPALFGHPEGNTDLDLESKIYAWRPLFPGTFIFGGYDQDASGRQYNSMYFWFPNNPKPTVVYHKNKLLMFGETLPFAETFPIIKTWFPNIGFFGPGSGTLIIDVPTKNPALSKVSVSPNICYEALDATLVSDASHKGAQAILNITNDSWFGTFGEPYLHLALTQFRPVETRIPLIRSTNTGISTIILPSGDLLKPSPLFQEKIVEAEVPILHETPNFIATHPALVAHAYQILALLAIFIAAFI